MLRPKVLQVGFITDRFGARAAQLYDVVPLWEQPDPKAYVAKHGGEFQALITSARFGCTSDMITDLPNLRAICSFGVGFDSIAVDTAHERGVLVSNTPDVLNQCVADLAMGLLIDVARRISEADRFVRAERWSTTAFPLATRVSGKKLGIVGLGGIGREIAKRAQGFDMQISYHARGEQKDSGYRFEADLHALASWADFLVLACPGGPQTRHLVSAQVLDKLGPQGILINIARGSVVDEQALVDALVSARLGGAGLDVYSCEPAVPPALFALPNVVLAPHIGSGTEETRLQMEERVLSNLEEFFRSGQVLDRV